MKENKKSTKNDFKKQKIKRKGKNCKMKKIKGSWQHVLFVTTISFSMKNCGTSSVIANIEFILSVKKHKLAKKFLKIRSNTSALSVKLK